MHFRNVQIRQSKTSHATARRGTALITVLVVILLLSLAAYTFTEKMILESEASEFAARQAQARASADSGVDYVAALLADIDAASDPINTYHDPSLFAAMPVHDPQADRGIGMFTLVAPVVTAGSTQTVRAGLIDESGKLNVNAVLSFDLEDDEARELFLGIPGMTEQIADGILDWVDEDTERRQYGAEDDFYSTLSPPYTARNSPLESLDELLLVNGMTPALLYGEDANRNGILDPNENDGPLSLPIDNQDGQLDLGCAGYLTVYSRESNLQSNGAERINVNDSSLVDLYDALEEQLGEDEAQFIVAYRMYGATNVEPLDGTGLSSTPDSTGDQQTDDALMDLAGRLAKALGGGNTDPIMRGGMDLSMGPRQEIDSLYELIGAEVVAEIDGSDETLASPWQNDSGALAGSLPLLFDVASTIGTSTIDGRINVNQARKETLLGIPNMPSDLADAIANSPLIGPDGQALSGQFEERQTTAWLLTRGLADVTTMRQIDRFITARGEVFTVQVLGHFDVKGPVARIEAVVDAVEDPPQIIARRNLSELGPGYDLTPLVPAGGP